MKERDFFFHQETHTEFPSFLRPREVGDPVIPLRIMRGVSEGHRKGWNAPRSHSSHKVPSWHPVVPLMDLLKSVGREFCCCKPYEICREERWESKGLRERARNHSPLSVNPLSSSQGENPQWALKGLTACMTSLRRHIGGRLLRFSGALMSILTQAPWGWGEHDPPWGSWAGAVELWIAEYVWGVD